MESAVDCGTSLRESFGYFDHATSSLRTSQRCLPLSDETDELLRPPQSQEFLVTYPSSGTMRSGKLYRLPEWAHHTDENECSSLPTPAARDYRDVSLNQAYPAQRKRHQPSLATETLIAGIGGERICQVYLWAMGFPRGWLDLE